MDRLEQWARFLDAFDPKRFSLAVFIGETYCAVGLLPQIFPEWHEVDTVYGKMPALTTPENLRCDIMNYFGLTDKQVCHIIYSIYWDHDPSPKEVADRIRSYHV